MKVIFTAGPETRLSDDAVARLEEAVKQRPVMDTSETPMVGDRVVFNDLSSMLYVVCSREWDFSRRANPHLVVEVEEM